MIEMEPEYPEKPEFTKKELKNYAAHPNPYFEKMRVKPRTTTHSEVFQASDGLPIYYRHWTKQRESPQDLPLKVEKVVICLHGLHSHGQKFQLLADNFVQRPWLLVAPDLRGHGLSYDKESKRGDIEDFSLWVQDLLEFTAFFRNRYPGVPVYLIAESMGATLAVLTAYRITKKFNALVLLSPALKPFAITEVGLIQRAFAYGLLGGADNLNIRQRAQGRFSSNSEEYIEYQMHDKLRLERVSPRYYYQVIKMVHQLKPLDFSMFSPSCLFYGEKDHIIDLEGMREYIRRLGLTEKALHYVPNAFHELLTDVSGRKYRIFRKIAQWISDH